MPFTKAPTASSGGKGDLILDGYASTWGLDRDEELVAPDAFSKSLAPYLQKNPMLLWQHNPDWPIGSVTTGSTDETGLYVKAVVPNPGPDSADWQKGAYTSIKNGVVRTFSIGGYFARDVKQGPDGPVFYIVEIDLFEISCVSIPANADSIYEAAVKALNGERRPMPRKAHEQLEQLMGVRVLSDPELRSMTAEERSERWKFLSGLFEEAYELEAPPRDAFLSVMKAREAGVEPAHVQKALSELQRSLSDPLAVAQELKAGRAISASNRSKLETALDAHKSLEGHMVDAADSMRAAADDHAASAAAIKDVLGVSDDPVPDPDRDDDEDEDSPEKSAGSKQLTRDLFARFGEAGRDRFAADVDDDEYCYVYVDDFDLDQGFVVYCVSDNAGYSYYQVAFTRDPTDGGVALAVGQTEVSPTTGYVPKSAASEIARTQAPPSRAKALPTCPECGATITDPSKGCPNSDCDYTVPKAAAGDAKGYAPVAYERQDETVGCPNCNLFNDPDASYCDQCGQMLAGREDVGGSDGSQDGEPYDPIPYRRDPGENVQCPECGLYDDLDASYCDQCGTQLAGADGVLVTSATSADVPSTKGALAAPSAAFAPRDTAWSAAAAVKRLKTWAGADDAPNAKYARAFLFCEGGDSSEKFGDYKYAIADIVDGEFKCVFRAVSAAAGRAQQQNLTAIFPSLRVLYARASKQFDDPDIKPPFDDD